MQTTLNEIKKYDPCPSSWAKGLKYLNKSKADDEPIDFMVIYEVMGIKDALWCLRTQDYRDYCLFLADVAELVLHIFEDVYPDNKAPRQAIEAIRDWYNGDITDKQLEEYASAARAACNYGANAAARAISDAAHAYAAVYGVAYATACDAAHAIAAYSTTYDTVFDSSWRQIDKIFIKHFN